MGTMLALFHRWNHNARPLEKTIRASFLLSSGMQRYVSAFHYPPKPDCPPLRLKGRRLFDRSPVRSGSSRSDSNRLSFNYDHPFPSFHPLQPLAATVFSFYPTWS
ncbi:hypothetical protein FA13DRAFT_1069359 [Coprinellus micaceus]|uniref:Uncharacterized protein n=1 Tax=Coprinellus micaceus TaxID=71717 RepID=A0A4Y7TQW8_COPMI|nr:hypothetical protein FA13DRAFT_1069359 [Coprinellus micaceus]